MVIQEDQWGTSIEIVHNDGTYQLQIANSAIHFTIHKKENKKQQQREYI